MFSSNTPPPTPTHSCTSWRWPRGLKVSRPLIKLYLCACSVWGVRVEQQQEEDEGVQTDPRSKKKRRRSLLKLTWRVERVQKEQLRRSAAWNEARWQRRRIPFAFISRTLLSGGFLSTSAEFPAEVRRMLGVFFFFSQTTWTQLPEKRHKRRGSTDLWRTDLMD